MPEIDILDNNYLVMHFLKTAWDTTCEVLKTTNGYGFPLPIVLGALILYFFVRRGMKWPARQRYYVDILQHLGMWQDSLRERLSYYIEPGSAYRDDPATEHFSDQTTKGCVARKAIREQVSTARLFLSVESMEILDDLVSEYWDIREIETVSTLDYLERTLEEVKAAYEQLLTHARRDLQRSQYLDIVNALKPSSK